MKNKLVKESILKGPSKEEIFKKHKNFIQEYRSIKKGVRNKSITNKELENRASG